MYPTRIGTLGHDRLPIGTVGRYDKCKQGKGSAKRTKEDKEHGGEGGGTKRVIGVNDGTVGDVNVVAVSLEICTLLV